VSGLALAMRAKDQGCARGEVKLDVGGVTDLAVGMKDGKGGEPFAGGSIGEPISIWLRQV